MLESRFSTPVALLIAGALIALAVYEQPAGAFQIVQMDHGNVARINTRTGAGQLCGRVEGERRCVTLFDRQGQYLPKLEQEQSVWSNAEQSGNKM